MPSTASGTVTRSSPARSHVAASRPRAASLVPCRASSSTTTRPATTATTQLPTPRLTEPTTASAPVRFATARTVSQARTGASPTAGRTTTRASSVWAVRSWTGEKPREARSRASVRRSACARRVTSSTALTPSSTTRASGRPTAERATATGAATPARVSSRSVSTVRARCPAAEPSSGSPANAAAAAARRGPLLLEQAAQPAPHVADLLGRQRPQARLRPPPQRRVGHDALRPGPRHEGAVGHEAGPPVDAGGAEQVAGPVRRRRVVGAPRAHQAHPQGRVVQGVRQRQPVARCEPERVGGRRVQRHLDRRLRATGDRARPAARDEVRVLGQRLVARDDGQPLRGVLARGPRTGSGESVGAAQHPAGHRPRRQRRAQHPVQERTHLPVGRVQALLGLGRPGGGARRELQVPGDVDDPVSDRGPLQVGADAPATGGDQQERRGTDDRHGDQGRRGHGGQEHPAREEASPHQARGVDGAPPSRSPIRPASQADARALARTGSL